jgi:hypothetical protein
MRWVLVLSVIGGTWATLDKLVLTFLFPRSVIAGCFVYVIVSS